jgi:hypothetical protein
MYPRHGFTLGFPAVVLRVLALPQTGVTKIDTG